MLQYPIWRLWFYIHPPQILHHVLLRKLSQMVGALEYSQKDAKRKFFIQVLLMLHVALPSHDIVPTCPGCLCSFGLHNLRMPGCISALGGGEAAAIVLGRCKRSLRGFLSKRTGDEHRLGNQIVHGISVWPALYVGLYFSPTPSTKYLALTILRQ